MGYVGLSKCGIARTIISLADKRQYAEWEYKVRGGLSGKGHLWDDKITHDNANYRKDDQIWMQHEDMLFQVRYEYE